LKKSSLKLLLSKNIAVEGVKMLKEKGYDEFLAEKIQKGLDDFANGRYLTAEQSRQRIEELLVRKEQELQTAQRESAYG
jgi:hypothetical protein